MSIKIFLSFFILFVSMKGIAAEEACGEMEVWDYSMAMCMPFPMKDMPMKMLMLQGNSFFTQSVEEGRRGRNEFSVPNMIMADIGTSVGDRQYFNLDFMGTSELWTIPKKGYPELLQVGEENKDHEPYVDAQHPHSSPVMGLTLSDTISLGRNKDHIKVWFAPRGQSTDGPVAFMHRPTGMVNPDAPLGHHVGQDVGHISSTVVGALIHLDDSTLEVSSFNGTEPKPAQVDLPMGALNSYAARLTVQLTPNSYAMISAAKLKSDEDHAEHIERYSASLYNQYHFENGWMFHNTLIYGLVNGFDNTGELQSFAEEFWFHRDQQNIWSRIEVLQRTPAELEITSVTPSDSNWVTAVTLGYTYEMAQWDSLTMGLGVSVTNDFLPSEFESSYSGDPLSGKVFLQVSGLKMWDL